MTDRHIKRRSPPQHLSTDARALWLRLYRERSYNESSSLLLLTSSCEAVDRGAQCRAAHEGQSMTIVDKHGGCRIHQLLVEERACREQAARLARILRIHLEPEDDDDAA